MFVLRCLRQGSVTERSKKEASAAPMLSESHPNLGRGDGRSHIRTPKQTSNLWERLSVSRFPFRFPLLYGSLLESRSFYHRIRCLSRRGDISRSQMGPLWETSVLGHLILNKRTQARIQDMQRMLSSEPWRSPEEWDLYLMGWDAGSEYSALAHQHDIPEHKPC